MPLVNEVNLDSLVSLVQLDHQAFQESVVSLVNQVKRDLLALQV